jgi:hypothetical protein
MAKTSGHWARGAAGAMLLSIAAFGIGCGDDTGRRPGLDAVAPDSGVSSTGTIDGGALDVSSFHAPGSATPATCLPCHEGQAPTTTAGWQSKTYAASPFDYGTNALGIRHGGGQDCAICHAGPGTGAWGDQPNWVGGFFAHASLSLADTTCMACHVSQRPDVQPGATAVTAAAQVGFDHVPTASVDCIGCHAATVVAGSYVNYLNPTTLSLPGGDWKGGQSFPGSTPVGFPGERTELQTTTLTLSPASDRVVSAVVAWEEIRNVMVHTAAAIPEAIRPAPAGVPDYTRCWHCHVSKNGVVTRYPPGKFHYALAQFTALPDGPTTPLPQPTQGCQDCHAATQPVGIAARSTLRPMKHGITFVAPATVGGVLATGVADLDCSTCHQDPAGEFANSAFHRSVAGATLRDCVSCHYVTIADGLTADVQSGTDYRMQHLSAQVPFHTCTTCHPSALAAAAANPTIAAESWKPGRYHAVLPAQPTACNDCHAVTAPASHSTLTGPPDNRDCSECHVFPGTGTMAEPNWMLALTPAP